MAHDWDIKARDEICHKCETGFQDKETYTGTLTFGEEGYQRADFCNSCWESMKSASNIYSMWQSVFKMPPPPEEEALKKETAESLLRKLIEQEDESKANVIFILAVMLERKKILVERDVQVNDDGKTIRIYEHKKTGETFVVLDPRIQLDQLEHVQEEVVLMLGGKVPARITAENEEADADSEDNSDDDELGDDEPDDELDDDDDEYED